MDQCLESVRRHYESTISKYGATPRGVDWPDRLSQELRFVQLLKICNFERPLSINDFGCGYGALATFLRRRFADAAVAYKGYDFVPAMIAHAKQSTGSEKNEFFIAADCLVPADYTVASGVFNVMLGADVPTWEAYIEKTLHMLAATSSRGFSVNFLGPPHRASRRLQELYRTRPERWIGYCADAFNASVEAFGDYGLHEFTLCVRKPEIEQDDLE